MKMQRMTDCLFKAEQDEVNIRAAVIYKFMRARRSQKTMPAFPCYEKREPPPHSTAERERRFILAAFFAVPARPKASHACHQTRLLMTEFQP
jgi:hypothetical protein